MANVMITEKSKIKMVKARAEGLKIPKIMSMAFGDGGVDSDGKVISPAMEDNELKHEVLRKKIDDFMYPIKTTCRYSTTLQNQELAGIDISEIGLIDEEGDFVAIKTFGSKLKDNDMEMEFQIDDEF